MNSLRTNSVKIDLRPSARNIGFIPLQEGVKIEIDEQNPLCNRSKTQEHLDVAENVILPTGSSMYAVLMLERMRKGELFLRREFGKF